MNAGLSKQVTQVSNDFLDFRNIAMFAHTRRIVALRNALLVLIVPQLRFVLAPLRVSIWLWRSNCGVL